MIVGVVLYSLTDTYKLICFNTDMRTLRPIRPK